MKIAIARPTAPSTHLNIELISKGKFGERPVAFILPGGPGAALDAYKKYECLSEVVDLVFHDPRGCGQSDRAEQSTYNMNNYIDDVNAIREHLGLQKIIVIGKSYGSMCALGYALRYPHTISKLVLSAGAPSYRFLARAKENMHRLGTPEQIQICEKIWVGGFENKEEVKRYFELTNSMYSVKARTQPDTFDLAKKSDQFSYEVLNEGFKNDFWHFDFEDQLQTVAMPTLVLAGREDWVTDVTFSVLTAEKIPNSTLRIFENASHAMESDVQDEYFQTIADFVS